MHARTHAHTRRKQARTHARARTHTHTHAHTHTHTHTHTHRAKKLKKMFVKIGCEERIERADEKARRTEERWPCQYRLSAEGWCCEHSQGVCTRTELSGRSVKVKKFRKVSRWRSFCKNCSYEVVSILVFYAQSTSTVIIRTGSYEEKQRTVCSRFSAP